MPTTTRPTTERQTEATSTGPRIELQQRAPAWALAVRQRKPVTAIPSVMAEVLPETWHVAERIGCHPIAPFARYHSFAMPDIDFEAGCLVDGPLEHGEGRVEAVELPGGEVAVAIHVGSYERLAETYEAVQRWVAEQGRTAGAPMWEVYLDDPDTTPRDALRTEVVVPLD